jgi:hypothetical protein
VLPSKTPDVSESAKKGTQNESKVAQKAIQVGLDNSSKNPLKA